MFCIFFDDWFLIFRHFSNSIRWDLGCFVLRAELEFQRGGKIGFFSLFKNWTDMRTLCRYLFWFWIQIDGVIWRVLISDARLFEFSFCGWNFISAFCMLFSFSFNICINERVICECSIIRLLVICDSLLLECFISLTTMRLILFWINDFIAFRFFTFLYVLTFAYVR